MVLEEMSKCTGCGKPRFTEGYCESCQAICADKLDDMDECLVNAINGLTCIEGNIPRVEEITQHLQKTKSVLESLGYSIRELQTQKVLLNGMYHIQDKRVREVTELTAKYQAIVKNSPGKETGTVRDILEGVCLAYEAILQNEVTSH